MVSLALNHALVDGNKRLALSASLLFCHINAGRLPTFSNDEAYDLVIAVCEHRADVPEVAEALRKAGVPDQPSTP
jgi:death-on-curing protein